MSYIDRNLLPDENILFRTKKHKIIFLYPFVLTLFCLYTVDYMRHDVILQKLIWAPCLVVLVYWINIALEYLASEFAVTNKRVMMREGFFYRHANELRLSAISQVSIEQSLLGQLMNYGVVIINAFGAFDAFTMIANPVEFQRQVNQQLDKVTR